MGKNYGAMVSFDNAIKWAEGIKPVTPEEIKEHSRVLARLRYERDMSVPVKPKTYKGRYTTYSCGNCGHGITEIGDNFCANCGRAIKWDSTRCLTK